MMLIYINVKSFQFYGPFFCDCPGGLDFYHAYVNAYISICECWSVGECRKVLEVSVEVFHHLF